MTRATTKAEVISRLEYFVKVFVTQFENKYKSYFSEATGHPCKTGRGAKIVGICGSALNSVQPGVGFLARSVVTIIGKQLHMQKANTVTSVLDDFQSEYLRSLLVRGAADCFRVLESQFMQMAGTGGWKVGVSIIAKDMVDRLINYIHNYQDTDNPQQLGLSDVVITKSLVYGESKWAALLPKLTTKQKEEWELKGLLDRVGVVVKTGPNNCSSPDDIYYRKVGGDAGKYGYRLQFSWEAKNSSYLDEHLFVLSDKPITVYEYLLDKEDLPEVIERILNELSPPGVAEVIDEVESTKLEILEAVNEVKNDICDIVKKGLDIQFDVKYPTHYFVGRGALLQRLHSMVTDSGLVLITQKLINRESDEWSLSVGKSELARKYLADFGGSFENLVWLNATNYDSLEESVLRLISQHFSKVISTIDFMGYQKDVELLLADIYEQLRSAKVLVVFDNAGNDADLDYPSLLAQESNEDMKTNRFCIITSRLPGLSSLMSTRPKSSWGLALASFSASEAVQFLKVSLECKLGPQDEKRLETFAQELMLSPQALRDAVTHVKAHHKKICKQGRCSVEDHFSRFKDEVLSKRLNMVSTPVLFDNHDIWDGWESQITIDELETPLRMASVLSTAGAGMSFCQGGAMRFQGSSCEVAHGEKQRNFGEHSQAWFNWTNVMFEFRRLGLSKDGERLVKFLDLISPRQHPLLVSFLQPMFDSRVVTQVVEILEKYNLISLREGELRCRQRIEVKQEDEDVREIEDILQTLVELLRHTICAATTDEAEDKREKNVESYLAHFSNVWHIICTSHPKLMESLSSTPVRILEYLLDAGRLELAYYFGSQVLRKANKFLGSTHEVTRRARIVFAAVLFERGMIADASRIRKRSLADGLDESHESTLLCWRFLRKAL